MTTRYRFALALVLVMVIALPSAASTILGTENGALIGGDLTDPDNNINRNDPNNPPFYGSGYDFIDAIASSELGFAPGNGGTESALNVFDNAVGVANAKWCCDAPPQYVGVEFAGPYILTHFTIASGNDVPDRDPDVWYIEGSNDGSTWTPIFTYDNDGVSPFSARNQVIRYDVGVDYPPPPPYTWFRYHVTSTVGGGHQIGELEFFGDPIPRVPAVDPKGLALLCAALALAGLFVVRRT